VKKEGQTIPGTARALKKFAKWRVRKKYPPQSPILSDGWPDNRIYSQPLEYKKN
jgi:hypothetical protein